MNLKNFVALLVIVTSAPAFAVVKPQVTPLLGMYQGDCELLVQGQQIADNMQLILERDGDKFKITMISMQNESVTSLKPGVESVEIDPDTGVTTTELLRIVDAESRKWVHTSRTASGVYSGFDTTGLIKMDFTKPTQVKLKVQGTFGGEETHSGFCLLHKMNVRAL